MSSINFIEKGKGYPVVLLHGFCESHTVWSELADDLVKEYKVKALIPDLPGFGKSALRSSGFRLDHIAEMIRDWLQKLGIKRCIMMGHSLGGYITLSFLQQYPEMISGFGLVNSTAFEDTQDKKENRDKLIAFVGTNGVKPFIRTFVPSLFYPERVNEFAKQIEMIREEGLGISPDAIVAYASAMRDRKDHFMLLKEHADKALLIAGTEDQNVPLEVSMKMSDFLPPQHVHFLRDSAHMSMFEEKEDCVKAIGTFAKQIEQRTNS